MTEKEKYRKLRNACQIVMARFRKSVAVSGDAMQDFIDKGSMKEIVNALKL
ncbi:hypothetical protein LCGC14_1606150 [marine sediment metagenome]|uniref:Uncharacterized protein n=1 Tax=marine sediment metagenome TaxID=412755 RepID=A0A0F9KQG6_9ZZZZ